jgi:hypothetical protein
MGKSILTSGRTSKAIVPVLMLFGLLSTLKKRYATTLETCGARSPDSSRRSSTLNGELEKQGSRTELPNLPDRCINCSELHLWNYRKEVTGKQVTLHYTVAHSIELSSEIECLINPPRAESFWCLPAKVITNHAKVRNNLRMVGDQPFSAPAIKPRKKKRPRKI